MSPQVKVLLFIIFATQIIMGCASSNLKSQEISSNVNTRSPASSLKEFCQHDYNRLLKAQVANEGNQRFAEGTYRYIDQVSAVEKQNIEEFIKRLIKERMEIEGELNWLRETCKEEWH